MAENLAARGIKDKNEGLAVPRFRTVADFIFSGSQWKMRELAFGDQEVVFKSGDNKENYAVNRMPEIEQWATDIYNFVAGKYGEENIVAFYVHLDETSPHIHCVLLPIKNGKFAFKEIFAGANNREYSQRTSKLHDELAIVNEPWGLVRGTSQTETRQRHRPTEEYRKHLSEECSSKEEELDNLNKAVSDLRVEIALAERRVKGLSSMVEHLEEERHQKMLEIEGLLNAYADRLAYCMDSTDYRIYPKNDYSGLNSLRARLAHKDWNGMRKPKTNRSLEYSFSVSDSVYWNKYVAEMAGGTKCIGSPVFFFFKIGTTQVSDVSQMVNLDELARVAKAYHLKISVVGAADSATGNDGINNSLSKSRADYITQQLVARGIDKSMIISISEGGIDEYSPIAANRHTAIRLFVR